MLWMKCYSSRLGAVVRTLRGPCSRWYDTHDLKHMIRLYIYIIYTYIYIINICIIYHILYVYVYDYTSYTTYFFTAQSMIRACIYLHACIPRKLNHQLNWFVVVYTFPSKARAASCFPEFLKHLHGIWVFPYVVVPANTPKWSFLVGKPMVVGYHHFRKPPYTGLLWHSLVLHSPSNWTSFHQTLTWKTS